MQGFSLPHKFHTVNFAVTNKARALVFVCLLWIEVTKGEDAMLRCTSSSEILVLDMAGSDKIVMHSFL